MTDPQDPGAGGAAHRRVRSFVLREGRLTRGQEQALHAQWPRFGIDWDAGRGVLDLAQIFGNTHPVTLEIGFGMGTSLLEMAAAAPERNFLGIEVHRPGVGRLLHGVAAHDIRNLRVLSVDAVEFLRAGVAPGSLDRIQIYFPDPWPKKKHHKRRIVQPAFLDLCHAALCTGGSLRLATDWAPYAEHMLEVLRADPRFTNESAAGGYLPSPCQRPVTKFERRGLEAGRKIFDLGFVRA